MTNKIIETFVATWLRFDLQLRERQGLNNTLYVELSELLKELKPYLQGKDAIPKNLAEIFLDMWGAMTSCADMYDIELKNRIYAAADQLTYYARDICTS